MARHEGLGAAVSEVTQDNYISVFNFLVDIAHVGEKKLFEFVKRALWRKFFLKFIHRHEYELLKTPDDLTPEMTKIVKKELQDAVEHMFEEPLEEAKARYEKLWDGTKTLANQSSAYHQHKAAFKKRLDFVDEKLIQPLYKKITLRRFFGLPWLSYQIILQDSENGKLLASNMELSAFCQNLARNAEKRNTKTGGGEEEEVTSQNLRKRSCKTIAAKGLKEGSKQSYSHSRQPNIKKRNKAPGRDDKEDQEEEELEEKDGEVQSVLFGGCNRCANLQSQLTKVQNELEQVRSELEIAKSRNAEYELTKTARKKSKKGRLIE